MNKSGPAADSAISIRPRVRIYACEEIAFGPGKAQLLAVIARTGSLAQAARELKMSYMKAWSLVKVMNHCFREPLVQFARGGREGGGAEVTPAGGRVLAMYQRMEAESLRVMQPVWEEMLRQLKDC